MIQHLCCCTLLITLGNADCLAANMDAATNTEALLVADLVGRCHCQKLIAQTTCDQSTAFIAMRDDGCVLKI